MDNTYVKGQFRKKIFGNDNGYIVGLFKVKDTNSKDLSFYVNRTITFTGYFHELNDEDTYIFYGNLTNHEKYGDQFNVSSYERVMPEEKDSIVTFLSSGLFKGIGEKKAQKIVDVLGKDTLKIILENPENLLLIPTITKKQADILHNKLVEYEESYTTILALGELGFSTKDSMIIYNKYLSRTMKIIDNDIYQLMYDIEDISFKKVDSIAIKHEIKKDDLRRVKACIIYVLEEVTNMYGHSYLLNGEIYSYVVRCLGINLPAEEFDKAIESLTKDIRIVVKDEKYYLKNMYEAEVNIANRISYLTRCNDNESNCLDDYIKDFESFYNINYNQDQIKAIKESYLKQFLIITGGPGTGKTTIIKAITEMYRQSNNISYETLREEIALLAPTGRASKRIAESTLLPAVTIHRFLKWNKESNTFQVNEHNKSNVKFVIIDEASMIDTNLFDSLLKGLSYNTKIILVGDHNQLPSVGPGQILKDLIESNVLNVVRLNQLYRQKEDSNILTLAYNMNESYVDRNIFNVSDDLMFIPCMPTVVKNNIMEFCKKISEKDYQNIQVLAPLYKTINGIDELNVSLQTIFNPKDNKKNEVLINGIIFREKDKVIQLTNMPDENVFNGDIGYIERIVNTSSKKEVYIDFDGNLVKYTASNFNKFKHGYAISIHKSQGSEFDIVVMPMVQSYGKMLYRKLVYTDVTRCKKKLCIVGSIDALETAVNNNNTDIRRTTLKDMIIKKFS